MSGTRLVEHRTVGTRALVDILVAIDGDPLVTVARRVPSGTASLATNAHGDAAVIWERRAGRFGGRLMVATRRPSGRFGPPSTILGRLHGLADAAVAVGPAGEVVVGFAWLSCRETARTTCRSPYRRRVGARLRPARRSFGAVQDLGEQSGEASVELAFSADGRAVLAYDTQDRGSEANTPYVVRAATLAPGGRRFAPTQTLEAGGPIDRPLRTVYLAVAPTGAASVLWSAIGGDGTYPIRAARATTTGRFGRARTLAPSGTPADLQSGPDGTTIAVWTPDGATGVQAAVAAPDGRFGPAERVVDGRVRPGDAAAAFDSVTGRPTVVWSTGRRVFAADRLP